MAAGRSPAESHVTTAGRRLSLIGERANVWERVCSAASFVPSDIFLPKNRPTVRGEKTLVLQWHEFRYNYRCKAGWAERPLLGLVWYVLLQGVSQ